MDLLAAEISELSGKSPVDPDLRSIPYRAPQSTHHGPWSLSPSGPPRGETPIPSNISTEASPTPACLPRGPLTTILASDHGLSFGPANGLLQPGCSNLGLLNGSDDLNYDVHAVYNDMGSTVYPPFPPYPWNGQSQQELSSSGILEQEEGILTRQHQSLQDAKQCSTSAAQDSWISKCINSNCIIVEVDRQLQERNKDMERTDESKDEEIVKSTIKDNFQSTDTTQVKRTIVDQMTNDNECHNEKINCQSSPLSKDVLNVDPSPEKDEGTIHSSSTTFEKKVKGEGDQGKPLNVQATMEDVTQVEDQKLQQFGVGKIDRVQNETLEQDVEKVNSTQPEFHKDRKEDKFESDICSSKEAESQCTGSRGRHWKANEPAAPSPSFAPGSAECLGPNCRNTPAASSAFCSHRCILQQAACAIQQFERGQRTYKSGMPPTLVSIKQETISFIVCNDKEDAPIGDTGIDKEVVNGEHIIVNGTAGDLQLLGDTSKETDATGVRRFSDTAHGQQAQPKNKINKNGIPASSFYKTALQKSKKLCLQSRLELGTGAVLHLRKPSMERKPRLHLVEGKGSKNNFGNAERIKENAPASKSSHAGDLSSRQIVRRGLKDTLSLRLRENEDLSTTLKDVMKIAAGIEKELHSLFGSTSAKYKMKYRSLLFNLKDFKNPGLSHRVLTRDISPSELVNATPEQLASPELAGWRKRENEHMIELIEKEQQLKEHRPTAKITHKGLVEIGEPASLVDLQDSLSASEMPLTEKLHKGKERSGKNKMEVTGGQEGSFEHDNDCDGTTSKVSDEQPSEHSDCSCRTSPQECGHEKAFPGSPWPVPQPQPSKAEGTGVGFEALPGSVPCQTDGMGDNQLEGTDRSEEKTNDDSCPEATQGGLSKDAIVLQAKEQHPSEILGAKHGCGYIWKGFLCLPNVAKVVVKAYPVTGLFDNLTEDLPDSILIGGRISPHIVWDYLEKVKTVATKGISIIHFHPASEDEQEGYSALFTYLSKRQRCGVISASSQAVKDLYIVPYGTSNEVPANLLPQIQANTTYAESILGVLVQVRVRREPADEQSSTPSYSEQKMTSRASRKCKQNETSACVMSGSESAAGELKKAAKGDKSKESALHLAPKSSTATKSHCAIPAAEKPENNETPTARKADLSSSESAKGPDKSGIRNERFEHTSTEYSCPSELGDCVSTFPERGTVNAQKGSFQGGKMCSGLNFERDEGIATKFQPNDGKRIIKETNIAIDPVPRRQSHSSHSATKDKATGSGDCFDFEKWDVVRSNSISDPRINRLTLTKEGYLPRNTLQSDDVCTQSVKGDSQRLSLDLLQEIQRLLSKNIDCKLRESATLAEQIVEQDVKSSCNKRIWSSDSEMHKESDNNFNLVDYQTFDYQHGLQSKLPSKYNTEHESLVKTPFSRPASTATHKLDTGQMESYREMSHGSELDWQQQQKMSRPSLKRLQPSSSLDEMVHSNYLSKQSRGLLPTPPTDLSIQHHGPVIPPPPLPPPLPPPPPPPFQPMRSEPHGYPFPPFNPPPFTNPGYPAFWPPRMRFFPFRPPPPWGFQRPPRYARHCNPRFSSQRFRPFNADLEHVPLPPTVCYSEDLDCENSPVTSEVSHDFSAKSIAPQTAEQLKAHYDKSAISHMHPQGNQHLSRQSIPHVLGQVQSDIDNIPLRLQSDRNQGNCPSAQAPDCFDSQESNSPPMSPLSV
uniref:TFIIS central domain-containing protein n=1 Tax=Eptatretus burgeri TaxID=7764 RepID=A0A8C4R4B3_EPTBU